MLMFNGQWITFNFLLHDSLKANLLLNLNLLLELELNQGVSPPNVGVGLSGTLSASLRSDNTYHPLRGRPLEVNLDFSQNKENGLYFG